MREPEKSLWINRAIYFRCLKNDPSRNGFKGSMKYWDGQEVLVGDNVVADRSEGTVVYVIDTKQFSAEHPAGTWDYLGEGMMIQTAAMGLVHYPIADQEVVLVQRAEL
jgi:hypothetical protein